MKPVQQAGKLLGLILVFGGLLSVTSKAETLSVPAASKYNGNPVTLKGEFKKSGGNKLPPVVILLHGCGGLSSPVRSSLRTHAAALRANGFATFILDSFGPRRLTGGRACDSTTSLSRARTYRVRDVQDTIAFLTKEKRIDPENVFIMGQSNGGSVVGKLLGSAGGKNIRAAVAYYPWCGVISANPRRPLLVLSGEADDWTPPDRCKKLDKAGGNLTVITYPDAVHSFDLNISTQTYRGHKIGGNPKAARDSRKRMIAFFKKNLKP